MKYYIYVTRSEGGYMQEVGTIAYDGDITDNYDSFMFFDSEQDAEAYINRHRDEFAGECYFDIVKDN